MSYANYRTQYMEAEVLSRPKEWLVPLLYEHLLKNLRRAEVQIQARDFEGKAETLSRAADIVLELNGSLDHEKGGEFAARMNALYAYFVTEIHAVGRDMDTTRLGRLATLIAELHEAWVQAAEQVAPRARGAGGMAVLSA